MVKTIFSILALPAALIPLAAARTDLTGCTSTDVSSPAGASYAWYVPETGELCDMLDCGGGRAPPKTNVPGCPGYVGTATYSPSYLPGYSATQGAAASTAVASASESADAGAAAITTAAASAAATSASSDDYYDDSDYNDTDDSSAYVWRTADDPSATINVAAMSAWPSNVNTFYIPIVFDAASSSGTTWEAVIPITSNGVTSFVPASTPDPSDLPLICAIATTSGCGIDVSELLTVPRPTDTSTVTDTSATTSGAVNGSGVSSMTKSWVKTIPTFSKDGANDVGGGSVSAKSSSGSASASTGAAATADVMGKTVGGVGVVAAALGALSLL